MLCIKHEEWLHPGWCGSVDWVPACEPKGCQLDSHSGHLPGLWARSPGGGLRETTNYNVSLPLYLPPFPSLKMNKIFKKENDSKVSIKFLYLRFQENEVFVDTELDNRKNF